MKKFLLTIFLTLSIVPAFSQTIVSTSPENKNAILEEFTGINCVFCPQGHAIANAIKVNNPDDFFIVNVHAGGFATPNPGQPDFTTPEGDAIDGQASVAGYPAGTINRTVFPGLSQISGGTAMSRNNWSNAAAQTIQQSSYVNVGVEAEINTDTRLLTVHVEAYYTGDSPEASNKLNVALLQNNTLGPQTGGNMGNSYNHMHRLVDMITTTWGFDIVNTTEGSFIDETFQYVIPSDYNGVPAVINEENFEVVAFVSEGRQKIISGYGAPATLTSGFEDNDATIVSVDEQEFLCSGSTLPKVSVYNVGNNPITSLDFEYSANGEAPQTYSWTGNINSSEIEEISFPELLFDTQDVNYVIVEITTNDDNNDNNSLFTNFEISEEEYETDSLSLTINLDDWPAETTWEISDSSGAVLYSGGPYPGQDFETINETGLSVADEDCYTFKIFDSYGDGICCGQGNGSYTLTTSDGDIIANGGNFGSLDSTTFKNYITLSSIEFNIDNFDLYPNPSNGKFTIKSTDSFEYEVFDIQGRNVLNGVSNSSSKELDLSDFNSGVYLIKVINGETSKTQKLILK